MTHPPPGLACCRSRLNQNNKEKRIYTEEDFFIFFDEYKSGLEFINTLGEECELIKNLFKTNGEPYEPATPTAPSMSDEDKVWMAAIELYKTEQDVFIADRMFMAVNNSFELLDEFQDQLTVRQIEREGRP